MRCWSHPGLRALAAPVVMAALTLASPAFEPAAAQQVTPDSQHDEWGRVEHPDHPLSFEVPVATSIGRVTVFSLGQPRTRDGRKIDVTLFGVAPRADEREYRPHYRSLELGFFWVTEAYRGADPELLAALAGQIKRPEKVERFLRSVFYAGRSYALSDIGSEIVDGHPARRSAIRRTVAAGTSAERSVRGEVLVVAISEREALVVVGRFDDAADEGQRRETFARILRSLQIGGVAPSSA